ncbi:MAG: Ig-like domain-containing protein [Armatimonadota bacterium]
MNTLFLRFGLLLAAAIILSPAWATPVFDDGLPRNYSTPFTLTEGLERSYANELVTYAVTFPEQAAVNSLRLYDEDNLQFVVYQISEPTYNGNYLTAAKVSFWVDSLPAGGTRSYTLYHDTGTGYAPPPFPALGVTHTALDQATVDISNGTIAVRIWGGTQAYDPAADPTTLPGMLIGVKGTDGVWRGSGAMVADTTVTNHALTVYEEGALWRTYRQVLTFTGGGTYELRVKVFPDTDFVQLDEYGNNTLTWQDHLTRKNDQFLRLNDFAPDKFISYTTFATNIVSTAIGYGVGYSLAGQAAGGCWSGGGWGGVYATDAGKQDVIGIVPVKPGVWTGSGTGVTFNDDATYQEELRLSMAIGERHCLLVVTNKTKAVLSQAQIDATISPCKYIYWGSTTGFPDRITPDACYLWKLRNTWCDFPLNKVKDWVLTYNDGGYAHPRVLFGAPDDIPTVMAAARDRLLNDPTYTYQHTSLMNLYQSLEYIGTGAVADLFRTGTPQRDDWDWTSATGVVQEQMAVGYPSNMYILTTGQAAAWTTVFADVLWDVLPPAEKTRWSRYALALAYIVRDPDNWGTVNYAVGHLPPAGNFTSCRWLGLGMASVFFEGHPDAAEWRAFAKSDMDQYVATQISTDGVYGENLGSYYPFVWNNMNMVALALQRHGWGNYATDAKYLTAAQFFIDTLTPPDATFHQDPVTYVGKRMAPPIGDHPGAGQRDFGWFAWSNDLFGSGTPTGDQSQWAWDQNGRFYGTLFCLPFNLFLGNTADPQQPRSLVSKAWDDYGFLFRNHVGSGKESYFLLKNGPPYGHHHFDEGSFHLFGKGVLLAGDGLNLYTTAPACTYCDTQKTDSTDRVGQNSAFHHNLISFQGPTIEGYLRGQWQAFQNYDTLDYGHANIPKLSTALDYPYTCNDSYDRRCLLVKSIDPDGPEYYVLQDTTNGPDLPQWNLDVHSPMPTLNPPGRYGWALFPGFSDPGFGVALDTAFVTPSNPDIWAEQGMIDNNYLNIWGVKGHSLIHATPAAALGQADYWTWQGAGTSNVYSAGLSPDLQYVVSGGSDYIVRLWSRGTGNLLRTFPTTADAIWDCAVSPNNQLVAGSNRGHLFLWRLSDGVQLFDLPSNWPYTIAFAPDSAKVAVGDRNDGHVRIYNTSSGALLQDLTVESAGIGIWGLAFSPDSAKIAVAGNTRATMWDVATGAHLLNLGLGATWEDGAAGVSFSPDGATLLVGGIPDYGVTPPNVTLWDATVPPGEPLPYTRTTWVWRQGTASIHNAYTYLYTVKFSPDGTATVDSSNPSAIRDAADGSVIRQLTPLGAEAEDAVWTLDSREVWLAGTTGLRLHWQSFASDPDANTIGWPGGQDRYLVKPQSDGIYGVAISKGAGYVALGGGATDKNVTLWNRKTGYQQWASAAGSYYSPCVAIAPNLQYVAAGNQYAGNQVRLLNGSTGAQITALPTAMYSGTKGIPQRSMDFSPDAGTLAIISTGGFIRLYGTSDPWPLLLTITPGFEPYSVDFSPDGTRIAVGGNATVATWDVATGQQQIICATGLTWEDTGYSVEFSPDGTKLAVGSTWGSTPNGNDAYVTVWDATVPGGPLPYTRDTYLWRAGDAGYAGLINAVRWSPDGLYIIDGNSGNFAHLREAAMGTLIRRTPGTGGYIQDLQWASDGADFVLATPLTGPNLRILSHAGSVTFPFLTVHYPRYQADPSPVITSIADGKGATVQHAAGTDTILMSNATFSYNDGNIIFTGKVAAIRNMDGERWMTLVDGTTLTYNGHTLNSPGAYHFNPVVSLTAPTHGAIVSAPVTLTATASYDGGTVSKVEFYDGANKLGEDTLAPYSYTWPSPSLGAHTLTAKAIGSDLTVGTSEPVNITVNDPPTVSITSPTDGAVLLGDSLTLTADASDSDGTISKVEFYEGANLLGTDTATPYSYDWTSIPAGAYALTAKAYDNQNTVTTSSVVNITVWSTQDIGTVGQVGSASYSAPTFTVAGAGDGITGTADAFRFVYLSMSGDCTITARVASCTSNDSNARAGVMMRQDTTAGAKAASSLFGPSNNKVNFHYRTSTDGNTTTKSSNGAAAPYWVRLVRTGNTLKA